MKIFKSSKPIIIKSSGGTTAQLLALANAIFLSLKLKKPFIIKHNDYSTGTFRPLEIIPLLQPFEYELNEKLIKETGVKPETGSLIDLSFNIKIQIIKKITQNRRINFLINLVNKFRGYYLLGANKKNLFNVNNRAKIISGNFVPYLNQSIAQSFKYRFEHAEWPNPFSKKNLPSNKLIIHVRLGDMRKMDSRIPGIGGHGIINPNCYISIVHKFQALPYNYDTYVVSDEPFLALKLLSSFGIQAQLLPTNSVWEDLSSISSARIFIGCMSQFSFFGALVCDFKGGTSFLPLNLPDKLFNTKDNFEHEGFIYYTEQYLSADHWIFQKNNG